MIIESDILGAIEVQEADIYEFPEGMPGFEQVRQFVIMEPDPELPLTYLQAVNEANTVFLLCDPFLFYPEYDFELDNELLSDMEIQQLDDVAVRSVVTIHDTIQTATINLRAPIVFNTKKKLGRQFILQKNEYHTKHMLIRDAEKGGGEAHARADAQEG